MSFLKVFVEIKIPFKIRIRIMNLLWILIPDLHFIHRRLMFGSANSFESYCVHSKSPRTDRQTDGFFLLVLSSKTYKTWKFVKRREFFFSLMRLQYFLFLHTPYVMRQQKYVWEFNNSKDLRIKITTSKVFPVIKFSCASLIITRQSHPRNMLLYL